MMLRTTISRIKKVCTVAFVPRILRGDQRCSTGKFEIFAYAAPRKASKSTKSTDNDDCETNTGTGYTIIRREQSLIQKDVDESLDQKHQSAREDSRSEMCQRIIDQAFGKEEDNMMKDDEKELNTGEQYCSRGISIDKTRREIVESEMAKLRFADEKDIDKLLPDERIQHGVFKEGHELVTDNPIAEPDDLINNESILKSYDKKESMKEPAESTDDIGLVQQTFNIHVTTDRNLDEVDTPTRAERASNRNVLYSESTNDSLPLKEKVAKEEVDKYVHDQERLEMKIQEQALARSGLASKQAEARSDTPSKTIPDDLRNIFAKEQHLLNTVSEERNDAYAKRQQTMENRRNYERHLQATTSKETEEQLTQKVEHIDETPLVEAQKPKIEGFNVNPRVLGDRVRDSNPNVQCYSGNSNRIGTTTVDAPDSLDEVAKRCLDTPTGKIDEILLKEMEKLGIPMTSGRDNSRQTPVIEDDLVQMDVLKKQQRLAEKVELDLMTENYQGGEEKLYPTHHIICNEKILPKVDADPFVQALESLKDFGLEQKFNLHTNPFSLDPSDRKKLSYREDDTINRFSYYFVPPLQRDLSSGPDKLRTKLKSHSEAEIKLNPAEEVLQTYKRTPSPDITLNSSWNRQQLHEERVQRAYAKVMFNSITLCNQQQTQTQPLMEDHSFAQEQQSQQQPNYMYTGNAYQSSYYPAYNMWNQHNNMSHYTDPKQLQESYFKNMGQSYNHQQMNTPRETVDYTTSLDSGRVFMPDSVWQKGQLNTDVKSRSNLADDVWGEPDAALKTENKEDPYSFFTTLAPRPSVSTVDPSRLVDPELDAIIEQDINECRGAEETPESELLYGFERRLPTETQNRIRVEKLEHINKYLDIKNKFLDVKPWSLPPDMPESLNSLPKLDEDVSLSELLRRVRERSRIMECKNELKALGVDVEPAEGKCGSGRKATRCHPMAPRSPPNNPIPPPLFGLPPVKPRPPVCKPRKKSKAKCTSCEQLVSSGILLGPKVSDLVSLTNGCGLEVQVEVRGSKAELTDEIVDRLQTLGRHLGLALRRGRVDELTDMQRRGLKTLLARDYEPWAPIPSWPTPKKEKRKKRDCAPGCKIFPPPLSDTYDPPCNPKPCSFPRKSVSLMDCFAVSLGERIVYDLGEF